MSGLRARYPRWVTDGDASRSGASCPSCGSKLSAPAVSCERCPDGLSSDPTWPEPVEHAAVAGVRVAVNTKQEKLARIARALTVTVHRAGPTLAITAELQSYRSSLVELPVDVGVTLLERSGIFDGIPDTFIRLERAAEPVMCSVPARGLRAGDPAVLVLTNGDVKEEIQTLVR